MKRNIRIPSIVFWTLWIAFCITMLVMFSCATVHPADMNYNKKTESHHHAKMYKMKHCNNE